MSATEARLCALSALSRGLTAYFDTSSHGRFPYLLTHMRFQKGRSSRLTYALSVREQQELPCGRFIETPFRVCLLESGGFEYDAATQQLYKGETSVATITTSTPAACVSSAAAQTTGEGIVCRSSRSISKNVVVALQRLAVRPRGT